MLFSTSSASSIVKTSAALMISLVFSDVALVGSVRIAADFQTGQIGNSFRPGIRKCSILKFRS